MGQSTKRGRKPRKGGGRPKSGVIGRRRFLFGATGIVAAGIAAGVGVSRFIRASSPPPPATPFGPGDLAALPRHERGQTLSPTLFTGSVAAAYAVAQEVPALLDQLYCYCRCKENFGHKSLLSCYVGRHAST